MCMALCIHVAWVKGFLCCNRDGIGNCWSRHVRAAILRVDNQIADVLLHFARVAADYLVAALDPAVGDAIRSRSLDSTSVGVKAQAALRVGSDEDGYAEPNLWTGIGRARSGCGAAIVGSPRQVADKIESYRDLGIDTFILSGYPHLDECRRFAELVLPLLRA